MKFWKKSLLALGALTCLALPSLSSCNSVAGGDNIVFAIERVTSRQDSNGNTIITIYYTNEVAEPLSITIPRGISGEDGVGVNEVTYEVNEETQEVTLTITYTDEEREPTVITIPAIQGIDGLGIDSIELVTDEDGNVLIRFNYSDGTHYDVDIPEPVGIASITQETDPDDGTITITITYTDESVEPTILTIPRGVDGQDGIGIVNISYRESEDGTQFILTIVYSDDEEQVLTFDKPHSTQWHYGSGIPTNYTDGDEGDYYINIQNGYVYRRNANGWSYLFSFRNEAEEAFYCNVTFDGQGGTFSATVAPGGVETTANINQTFEAGTYIRSDMCDYDLDDFTPTYEGHTFNGWYTDEVIGPNTAHFTNITSVPRISSLTLYAQWVQNATPSA